MKATLQDALDDVSNEAFLEMCCWLTMTIYSWHRHVHRLEGAIELWLFLSSRLHSHVRSPPMMIR